MEIQCVDDSYGRYCTVLQCKKESCRVQRWYSNDNLRIIFYTLKHLMLFERYIDRFQHGISIEGKLSLAWYIAKDRVRKCKESLSALRVAKAGETPSDVHKLDPKQNKREASGYV